ncbi:hypothetical protein ACRZ3C_006102, partial [Pseudomonas aeruginosa]
VSAGLRPRKANDRTGKNVAELINIYLNLVAVFKKTKEKQQSTKLMKYPETSLRGSTTRYYRVVHGSFQRLRRLIQLNL